MSAVYFHSQHGEAELRGSERAYFGLLCSKLTLAVVDPGGYGRREELERLIVPDHHLNRPRLPEHRLTEWSRDFSLTWGGGIFGGRFLEFDGHPLDPFTINLNTASLMGSAQIKIAAWIHGQCEVHGYVEGPDREWLADLMQDGLDSRVYRQDQNWPDVIALLRQRDDEPVVMSYSVCDGFPSYEALTEADQILINADLVPYYDLPEDVRWKMGLHWLRSKEAGIGHLGPDTLGRSYGRVPVVTAFDLFSDDQLRELLTTGL